MKMVIVGGGKAGYNLARILLERRHTVSLIERDRRKCEKLADDLDAAIFRGDGTNVGVLEAAGALGADCFMAVTGSDQDNLVACQVARDHFHAKKVISRVNDPRNIETFRVLGIGNTVSSTEILTKMIEQEADLAHMHLIATLNQGKAGICSMTLPEDTRPGRRGPKGHRPACRHPGHLPDPPGPCWPFPTAPPSSSGGTSWWLSAKSAARRR